MDHNSNPLNWIATCCMGIMIIISILLALSSSYSTCKTIKSLKETTAKKSHIALIFCTFGAIFLFTISSILMFTMATGSLIYNDSKNNITLGNIGKFSLLLYTLSQTMMTVVFTLRIEVTYGGTVLQYSRGVIKGLMITVICLLLFLVFALFTLFAGFYDAASLCGGIWIILYLILSIILMVLFIKPIEKLMTTQMQCHVKESSVTSKSSAGSTGASHTSMSADHDQRETTTANIRKSMIDADFLFIVIKHGLLVPIAIISSFILFLVGIVIGQIIDPAAYNTVAFVWLALDATVSSVCTYLLCAENQSYYSKLCYKMHSICESRKINKIMKKMNQQTQSKQSENQSQRKNTVDVIINDEL